MAEIPPSIQERLKAHLAAIAAIFKAPRITLIVRGPEEGNAKGDLILGNDDPIYVSRALRARIVAESKILAGTPQEMKVTEKEKTDGGTNPHLECGGVPDGYQPRRGR
jgi:hypothetical protein